MKTYKVWSTELPDIVSEVTAKSRAKAIYEVWFRARDVGFNLKWTTFRARRIR